MYVVPFQPGWEDERAQGLPTPSEQAQWRISIAGGGAPRWKPDGGELYYISLSNSMVAVEVGTDGVQFTHDVGTALFEAKIEYGITFDVSADGEIFVINSAMDEVSSSISILTNWTNLLKE